MPHLVIVYTANLDTETSLDALCRSLARAMIEVRDETGKPIFPIGGVRVLAYPAPHYAVADGSREYTFAYLNLRMAGGRSEGTKKLVGDTLLKVANAHFATVFERRYLGVTLQIDEGPEVYDAKLSNIHPLFQQKS